MPIDPITSLAFAIQSQPGVYAVLVGSGVSRAARIPTGWGITNELIRRLATAQSASITAEPADWYEATYGKPVGFSNLLAELAPSRNDRRALLAGFIEPVPSRPDERRPTAAHHAMARLARTGHIRVFLTTNFDRLLEQALTDAGINPLVVSTPAQAAGAPAFQHAKTVVFKLNGDYLDPDSMLVTEDELVRYDSPVLERLHRTLEDYGLLVCGWSGDWDPALRDAIAATSARRYPLYFTAVGTSSTAARGVIAARSGLDVPIHDADSFFSQLEHRVAAIDRMNEPHPLDTAALVGAVKAALAHPGKRIDLEDLIMGTANRVHDALSNETVFPSMASAGTQIGISREIMTQAHRYEAVTRPLVASMVAGSTWGSEEDEALWARAANRMANTSRAYGGQTPLLHLRRLPALLVVYATGLAAVDRGNYGALRAVTVDVTFRDPNRHVPLLGALHPSRVVYDDLAAQGLVFEIDQGREPTDEDLEAIRNRRHGRRFTPVSVVLEHWMREPLRATIADDALYVASFDRLEMLLAMVASDVESQAAASGLYTDGPAFGAFTWRSKYDPVTPEARLHAEFQAAGEAWPPLTGGLFGGKLDRADAAFTALLGGAANTRKDQH